MSNWKKLSATFKPKGIKVPHLHSKISEGRTGRSSQILEDVLNEDSKTISSEDEEVHDKSGERQAKRRKLEEETGEVKIGKYIGIDCEMVGVGSGGLTSVLARCTLINFHGSVILDEYVLPQERVVDYRTAVSGITPQILKEKGVEFKVIQKKVADILKSKIIVGHALKNDLHALMLDHPGKLLRDTARYKPLKNVITKKAQSLKNLARMHLDLDIQTGEHSSVEDARAAMELYKLHKVAWEQTLYRKDKIDLKPHSW